MRIIDAIGAADRLRVNTFSTEEKVAWLDVLDRKVQTELYDTHLGFPGPSFPGYGPDVDLQETRLLIPDPFGEIYLYWLMAQMDYANGELAQYNNSIALYNTLWQAFANWVNRTHMPRTVGGFRLIY